MSIDVLLFHFEAPLMSLGGPAVDRHRPVQDFPALSMITGLLGNALGYGHGDSGLLDVLQNRLVYAARRDRAGRRLVDFQTVDLSLDHLEKTGWTTRGRREGRGGGKASSGTHIRLREYWADAAWTLAATLDPPGPIPDVETLAGALLHPERPLFLGRASCPPGGPLLIGREEADSLLEALERRPLGSRSRKESDPAPSVRCRVWAPASEWDRYGREGHGTREDLVRDERDWTNQVHCGQRIVEVGWIDVSQVGPGSQTDAEGTEEAE